MMLKSRPRRLQTLVVLIAIISAIWAIPDFVGPDIAQISSDLTNIALTVFLAVTAFFQLSQIRREAQDKITWVIFAVFAISYTAAQHIWAVNELIFDTRPFPSLADAAFLVDTLCLIAFFMLYVRPYKQSISRKMLAIATIPSSLVVLVSAYYYALSNSTDTFMNQILLFSYPFLDAIALVPATLGIMIWLKNKSDFPLLAICSSMIPLAIGDVSFQITTQNNTYYTGSFVDLFFYIQIVSLTFGVYVLSNTIRKNSEEKEA